MKTKLLLTALLSLTFCLLSSQVPKGFNYQAVARDGSGNPLPGPINVKIAILSSISPSEVVIWEELHSGVIVDDHGLFTIVVGQGTWQYGLANFGLIDWTVTPKYLRTKINDIALGTAQLWSVPYAMVADSLGGPVNKLKVNGAATSTDTEALFEVRNKGGKSVFAVYNDGVSIHVDLRTKGPKGGFSVGGFEAAKDLPGQKYLYADGAGVNIYIDDNPGKAAKGGFSVGGFDAGKGGLNFLDVSVDATGIVDPEVNRILWYPVKNAFLTGKILVTSPAEVGENSFATGFKAKAKGQYSQSMGYLTQALGGYSTAIGKNAVANNDNSFAFGDGAKALNQDAYALGAFAEAQGIGSFAFGYVGRDSLGPTGTITKAMGNYSFALGLGAQTGTTAEGAFAIGSGTNAQGQFSLAMGYKSTATDYYSVAIGRQSQASSSSVAIGSSAIASGSYSLALYGNATGYKSINIGTISSATGSHAIAIGGYSTNIPALTINRTSAVGLRSIAIGSGVGALGERSVAIGTGTYGALVIPPAITYGKAVADFSYAIGTDNISDGTYAFAIGTSATSTGSYSFAIGTDVTTTGSYSFGLGRNVTSSGNYSFALGTNVTSSGVYATAMGRYTTAQAYNSFVIGRYNVIEGTTTSWNDYEPLFVIGNGSSTSARSNAFSVRKDGVTETGSTLRVRGWSVPPSSGAGVEISYLGGGSMSAWDRTAGTQMPLSVYSGLVRPITTNTYACGSASYAWTTVYATNGTIQPSDKRKKDDIQELTGGLETVLDLNPVTFKWKSQSDGSRHLGLIAQEVMPLIPEVVDIGDDTDKTLGINYAGLVPVLINAIQEQQKQIDRLEKIIFEMQTKIASLRSQ